MTTSSSNPQPVLPAASIWAAHWVIAAVSCSVAGWLLSAVKFLTPLGLLLAIPLVWFAIARMTGTGLPPVARRMRLPWHRPNRVLICLFCVTALLALVGGIIHPPNNYDALNYRIPRTMHWLYAEAWHWIPANSNIVNTRASGFEWMTAPLLAWFKSDRPFFLINLVSFLLLPGLTFGVMRQMGVAARVAHAWMWVLPTGYCFVLQAGSIGNDLPAATFALAAFDFGFRWKSSRSITCLYLAIAAAGIMTAIKPTTLPLLLPFAILFFGMWRPVLRRPILSSVLLLAFFTASFLPNAIINHLHCGDWTGAEAEDPALGMVHPVQGIVVNLINAPIQNLAPPVFPLAKHWNAWFPTLFPDPFLESLSHAFEVRAARFGLTDIQGEESAGIGTGISLLWLACMFTATWTGLRQLGEPKSLPRCHCPLGILLRNPGMRSRLFLGAIFGSALLAYFAKTGMNTVARHISPYYPFLLAIPLAAAAHVHVVRSKWFQSAAVAAMLSSIILMIITPSRPLWPAQKVLSAFESNPSPIIKRAVDGYRVYSERADWIAPLRSDIPMDSGLVGFINFCPGAETPLWKPYFSRQVRHIRPNDDVEDFKSLGMRHIVLNTGNFDHIMGMPPQQWVENHGGSIQKRAQIRVLAKEGSNEWWVVELKP